MLTSSSSSRIVLQFCNGFFQKSGVMIVSIKIKMKMVLLPTEVTMMMKKLLVQMTMTMMMWQGGEGARGDKLFSIIHHSESVLSAVVSVLSIIVYMCYIVYHQPLYVYCVCIIHHSVHSTPCIICVSCIIHHVKPRQSTQGRSDYGRLLQIMFNYYKTLL